MTDRLRKNLEWAAGRSGALPTFTVIIAAPPWKKGLRALDPLGKVLYPLEKIQVLQAKGTLPSRQRNRAAGEAGGEILFFLDDDSEPAPDLFLQAARRFQDPGLDALGGPSLSHPDQSFWQACFTRALTSPFGGFGIGARYEAKGSFRPATEKELILCNFAIRRQVYLDSGGLDERLYPNEENEFCNRLREQGKTLYYDPELVVYRFQRKNLAAFARQIFRYGRGRMEHFVLKPSFFSPAYLAPMGFLLYLVFLAAWTLQGVLSGRGLPQGAAGWIPFLPLFLYLLLDLAVSLPFALGRGPLRFLPSLFSMALTFLVLHLSYGAGSIYGLFRGLALRLGGSREKEAGRSPVEVVPFHLPARSGSWESVLPRKPRKREEA